MEQYAWPTIARRVEDLYRKIIEAKRGAPPPPPMGLRFNLRREPRRAGPQPPQGRRAGRVPLRRPSEPCFLGRGGI